MTARIVELYEFFKGQTRIRGELIDHGESGFEARVLHHDVLYVSQTFTPADFAAPRQAAVHWAEAERKAIEARSDDWY